MKCQIENLHIATESRLVILSTITICQDIAGNEHHAETTPKIMNILSKTPIVFVMCGDVMASFPFIHPLPGQQ